MKFIKVLLLGLALSGAANVMAEAVPPAEKENITKAIMNVLDEYMASFNRMNVEAWESSFHFPHYRLASGKMTVLQGPSGRSGEDLKRAIGREWHHSDWEFREIVHWSQSKVHVATRFSRYRADNSVIATYDSLYVLTKEDGQWGIKLRSSMAP